PVGVQRPAVVKKWLERLQESERALLRGEWMKAKQGTEKLLTEMCQRLEGGEGVEHLLGTAAFLRSLAEAGLGNEAAANWDFRTALAMRPELGEIDLAPFGVAGEMLTPWRSNVWGSQEGEGGLTSEAQAMVTSLLPKAKVDPPRKIHAPKPKYPFAKHVACADGPIFIRTVIDEEGRPREPQLLSAQDPVLAFAALEALRDWRFEPARRDGEPVPVYYNLTVNFEVPVCTNLFARAQRGKGGE
ncbi:MAG: energy transducer TonB, partial [Acidobacteria bacterium]|nr:energy transducer TonB [Acidobacteriota bacterium]